MKYFIISLLIAAACVGCWIGGCLSNQPHVSDTATSDNMTGKHIEPVIVPASQLAAGVITQIDFTITMPATHEQGRLIESRPARKGYNPTATTDKIQPEPSGDVLGLYQKWSFTNRGGGEFDTTGLITFNPWAIKCRQVLHDDGSIDLLTDDPDIAIVVESAVRVKPHYQCKTSLSYLYGTDGSHEAVIGRDLSSWLSVEGGARLRDNTITGMVGIEVRR